MITIIILTGSYIALLPYITYQSAYNITITPVIGLNNYSAHYRTHSSLIQKALDKFIIISSSSSSSSSSSRSSSSSSSK